MTRPLEYNATLVQRTDLTDALSIFLIQPDRRPSRLPWFTAGQYCVLGLNNAQRPDLGPVRRSMSIVSAPQDEGPLEFYIRRVGTPKSNNPLTHLMWSLKCGDRLYLRSVGAGVFTIEDTIGGSDSRLRVLVAAGTGIAPFVSMIRSEVRRNPKADLSRWAILHGASSPKELGYRDEFLQLAQTNELRYWATVSRPGDAPDWRGDTGRVEMFFDADRLPDLERRLGLTSHALTPKQAVVYVCGVTGTITATFLRLVDRGFVPDVDHLRGVLGIPGHIGNSLFFEHYDPEPLFDTRDSALVQSLSERIHAALEALGKD
jgi:ferredoxin--NADP+ reductase